MARYIDADKLIKSLELSIKSWGRDCNSNAPIMMRAYQDALYRVKNMPTADVAPKSEVDQLQRKYDLAVAEREANVKGFAKEITKAKNEVARKIFEELEKEIDLALSVITKILNAKGGRANGKTVLVSKYAVFIEAKKFLAELKKKYTEVEDEPN